MHARKAVFLFVVAWLAACGPATAQEKSDAAARARIVAPFVEEGTVMVAHADLSRVKIEPVVALVRQLVPEAAAEMAQGQAQFEAWLDKFRGAGGKEVYVVVTVGGGLPPEPSVLVLVPIAPGADRRALAALFPGAEPPQVLEPRQLTPAEALRSPLPGPRGEQARSGELLVVSGVRPAGAPELAARLKQLKPVDRPEIAKAFAAAGDTVAQLLVLPPPYAARVIEETMPEFPKAAGGGPSTVLTRGLLWAAVGIDPPPEISLRLVIQSKDAQAAEAFRAKLAEWVKLVGQQKEVVKLLPKFDEIAALVLPKVEGDRLVIRLDRDTKALTDLLAVVQATAEPLRAEARRNQSVNNLKQLGLAMHNYHSVYRRFPAAAICDNSGKPLLSWRVAILPYIEQQTLYKQFHLDEPWDSEHNKKLIAKMPAVYRSPQSKRASNQGRTNYVVPVGPETIFPGTKGIEFRDIRDGSSNTILILEVSDQQAPIWTKPDDWPFDPKDPGRGLGGVYDGGFHATFADGSVRFLPLPQDAAKLRALFTRDGREPVLP
ncbi:MAG: DUF1559 domain-containing protein [Thermoguttaceae bacterium]|nr:DUF1559 domain-containing protein [Thermoguttaceae bacterium]